RSTLFDDVVPAIDTWRAAGREVRIYSSGSVHAQKLFFTHTFAGDLSAWFSGFYDTTTGSKHTAASYAAIAADAGASPSSILFVSDIVEELDAAQQAGLATALAIRPGNKPQPPSQHPLIHSFAEITLA
ncbi:MAG: acireductone synthase, partial [Roseimicrobium sp.]